MVQRKTSVAAGLMAVLAVGAWLALGGALGGCGQKGPLMLPAPSGSASAPAR